jgi:Holliday junction resolvase RusA-like endonuclease
MNYFSVTLDIAPIPKGRPRMTRRGHTYTPARTRQWETAASLIIRASLGSSEPFDMPVRVTATFICARPVKAHSDAGEERYRKHTRPDLDNLVKALLDAASNAQVWTDDSRVTELVASKVYGKKGERPHIIFEVEEMERAVVHTV